MTSAATTATTTTTTTSQPPTKDIEVREQDQAGINHFAILANQIVALKQQLEEIKTEVEAAEDAEMEAMTSDASKLRFRVVDVFVAMEEKDFFGMLEQHKEKMQAKMREMEETLKQAQEEQDKLKSELYGRFGDQIALEM